MNDQSHQSSPREAEGRPGDVPSANQPRSTVARRPGPSTASSTSPSRQTSSAAGESLGDTTLTELREIAGRYPRARSALLPMLHLVQSVEGQVTPRGIEVCADLLDLTAAEVSAVATFYTMYKRRPVGDYHVGVCTNTLCAIMGGDAIFDRLKEHLGVGNDEVTEDGKLTLEHVECNAACDYAPVMMVNWEFMDNMTPESATDLVDRLRAGEEVRSTRGPAGPESLVGLRIARERGWRAPEPQQSTQHTSRGER
jgi:NADH-quinone oxidoreductase subunit E